MRFTVLLETAGDFLAVTLLRDELPDIGLITVDFRVELTDGLLDGDIVIDFLELLAMLRTGVFFAPDLPAISSFIFKGRVFLALTVLLELLLDVLGGGVCRTDACRAGACLAGADLLTVDGCVGLRGCDFD